MLFRIVFLCVFVTCKAAYEGENCVKDGRQGVCRNLKICQAAIQDIRNRKNPQICSFDNSDPIVCCLDSTPTQTQRPIATTTKRPASTTAPYEPPVYDYVNVGTGSSSTPGCEAIPPDMTSPRTGQKSFDKCLEYQEKYLYPCEKGKQLTGELVRTNNCKHNAYDLIIGGEDAGEQEFPHMVLVGYGDTLDSVQWLCGGTIVSERYILTAGHCIASRDLGNASFILTSVLRRRDAQASLTARVRRVIKHPEYKPPSKYHDIALLEVEPLKLNAWTVPACLYDGQSADEVLATGWGLTAYGGQTSDVLQKVILNKFTTAECSEKYTPQRLMKQGFDPQTQTCYGDRTKSKDTCQGDSGGPIQVKSVKIKCMYLIVGVTSFGKGCGFIGEPGIYTRLAHYLPWIEGIVWA